MDVLIYRRVPALNLDELSLLGQVEVFDQEIITFSDGRSVEFLSVSVCLDEESRKVFYRSDDDYSGNNMHELNVSLEEWDSLSFQELNQRQAENRLADLFARSADVATR